MNDRQKRRAVATKWLNEYMKHVVCQNCGATPVEWHNEDHIHHPNARVGALRTQGASIKRIQEEIERCDPLCRSCHMSEDGRLAGLHLAKPRQPGTKFVPEFRNCGCCGNPTKSLRRNLCLTCYLHQTGIRKRRTPSCDGCCHVPVEPL